MCCCSVEKKTCSHIGPLWNSLDMAAIVCSFALVCLIAIVCFLINILLLMPKCFLWHYVQCYFMPKKEKPVEFTDLTTEELSLT